MSVLQKKVKIVSHRHEYESVLPVGEGDAAEAGAARRHSLGEGDAAVVDQRHCLVAFPVRESTHFSYGTF